MGYLCNAGEEVEGSGKDDLVGRVDFEFILVPVEFLLVFGKLVLIDKCLLPGQNPVYIFPKTLIITQCDLY